MKKRKPRKPSAKTVVRRFAEGAALVSLYGMQSNGSYLWSFEVESMIRSEVRRLQRALARRKP